MSTIEFPGLWGLKLSISPIALSLGNINIYWYGIIIATGFMLAVLLAMRDSKKLGIEQEDVIDLVLWAAPVAIICARLYYVIFKWEDYSRDLTEIFKIWHGGLAIYGGIIGGLVTAFFFARHKKIPVFKLFDLGVPYLALAQSIGRWGNFINQEAYGTNTTLPWGMTSNSIKSELSMLQMQGVNVDPNLPVHPTFLYESVWNLATFFLLIWYRGRKKFEGEIFFLYMVLYGAGRFWIEGLRTDSLMLGNLRISQVLAFVFAVTFAVLLFIKRKRAVEADDNVELGTSEYGAILKHVKETETLQESEEITQNNQHTTEPIESETREETTQNDGKTNTDTVEESQEKDERPDLGM